MAVIEEQVGDIFDAPPNSVLILTCNTRGDWDAGIASAFKQYSPSAFEYLQHYCNVPFFSHMSLAQHQSQLLGTYLLISPFSHEYSPVFNPFAGVLGVKPQNTYSKFTATEQQKRFWIACLFTSNGHGNNAGTPESVLQATASALNNLDRELAYHRGKLAQTNQDVQFSRTRLRELINSGADASSKASEGAILKSYEEQQVMFAIGKCYFVKINSELLGVPWEKTKDVMKKGKRTSEDLEEHGPTGVKDDLNGLKKELKRLKEEMRRMQDDMIILKGDVLGLKLNTGTKRENRDCEDTGTLGSDEEKQARIKFEDGSQN
ncbi:MAG: hypothetical protein Q9181_008251 [Wetmoreana brouardii]